MSTPTSCPSSQVLEQLLLGLLPGEEADQMEAHLEVCPRCLRLVSALPAEDEIVQAMRSARQPLVGGEDTAIVEALCQWLAAREGSETESPQGVGTPEEQTATFSAERDKQTGQASPRGGPANGQETLGRFRLLRQLGAGGMGVVWLAFDTQLARQVALKVIHPRRANNPEAAGQFLMEARAMAKVESDHIVPVYDVNEDNGTYFLAMPLLKGETLESRLRRTGKQTLAEVLRIGREIALGLAAAHARDLIHRDIKPSNVWLESESGATEERAGSVSDGKQGSVANASGSLLTLPARQAGGGRVKILDFGLSCMLTDVAGRSVPGGTPAYMAPEQAVGQPVDFRADLFSLGCVLYFLTAGVPPFVSSDYLATVVQVASVEPPPPRQLNPEIPAALDSLIRRLMSKKPDERLASAEQVVAALEEIENAAERKRRRRARRLWLLGATLTVAGACALTVLLIPAKQVVTEKVIEPPTGKAALELEPGDLQVALVRDGQKHPVKHKSTLELKPGTYQVSLEKPQGKLRPWPDTVVVKANEEVKVPVRLIGEQAAYAGHTKPVNALALSPRALRSLSGSEGELLLTLWEPLSGKSQLLEGQEAGVGCFAAFSPDGKQGASGEAGRQKVNPEEGFSIFLWDLEPKAGGDQPRKIGASPSWVTALAWRPPEGKQLLVGDFDGTLRLWNLARRQATDLGNHQGRVTSIAVSSDGARAITGGFDQRLLLWDLGNQKLLRELLPRPSGPVLAVALTADGRTVVAGSASGHIHAWDLQTGKATILTGHKDAVHGVAVSADGSRLVSGGKDGTVRLWDLVRGQELEVFREQRPGEVCCVALSADGKHALTGSRGGISARGQLQNAVRLWRLP